MNITFLGPLHTTFSHEAYDNLAQIFRAPTSDNPLFPVTPVKSNREIVPMICDRGGYGAVAMETLAGGRVDESLEPFIDLLSDYRATDHLPFKIIGAVKKPISFCLMTRPEVELGEIKLLLAHPKALQPCRSQLTTWAFPIQECSSNGEAARLIAEEESYARAAALGPRRAAKHYGLKILAEGCEDKKAVTTFFLLGPINHQARIGCQNRALLVFSLPHRPGALVQALMPFSLASLNLMHVHSVHNNDGNYRFAIEIEIEDVKLDTFRKALNLFDDLVEEYLCFGPFAVEPL